MLDFLTTTNAHGELMPWSFLFATALIASALDAFSRRLFNPVVLTAWFFGLTVCASIGSWSIPELTAGAICLMTPHFLICSFAARLHASKADPVTAPAQPQEQHAEVEEPAFEFRRPKPVAKPASKPGRKAA
jgi:hypothetical protein